MEKQSQKNTLICEGEIHPYSFLEDILTETAIKKCFKQCTEKIIKQNDHLMDLSGQSFQYAICVRNIQITVQTFY
jgi:hypothetical protein